MKTGSGWHKLWNVVEKAVPIEKASFDHSAWDRLLSAHVYPIDSWRVTQVDYAGMAKERESLKGYLERLAAVTPEEFALWPNPDQLAFLINAYNAWTVELILTKYPDLTSIEELGSSFQSPWEKAFIPLLGQTRSLDDIIRGSGRYRDPRIHFAFNRASIGSPALRAQAYTGAQLEKQLEEQAELFLSDRSRNRLEGNRLKVSFIFKWYRSDFEKGWRGANTLSKFLALYVDALDLNKVDGYDIDFLDYDWRLNDKGNLIQRD